jgi:hypothetical protein
MDYIIKENEEKNEKDIIVEPSVDVNDDSGARDTESQDPDKYPPRYKWLAEWSKWSDKQKASIFCPLTVFVQGYFGGSSSTMSDKITETIVDFNYNHCRRFDKIVTGVYDEANVKGDLLIFKPIDIYRIPAKFSDVKSAIISWAKENGYDDTYEESFDIMWNYV